MMLATIMIPEVARFIPNYLTVIWLGRLSDALFGIPWFNNWPSLTIPFMATPFTIFLLRQFFMQIPEDLWDAARIDGAGHFRYLRSVVVPLSKAPIMTSITFGFIGSWNALLWPLLLTQTDDWRPVAVGLTKFVQSDAPTAAQFADGGRRDDDHPDPDPLLLHAAAVHGRHRGVGLEGVIDPVAVNQPATSLLVACRLVSPVRQPGEALCSICSTCWD